MAMSETDLNEAVRKYRFGLFPKVLAIIIVCLFKLDNKNADTMDDDDKRKVTQQCDVVLKKCKELNVGEQTNGIIRRFFGRLLNPEYGDQVCQLACSGSGANTDVCVIL